MQTLRLEIQGDIAVLTFDRPKQLNAINTTMLEELKTSLRGLARDKSVRCLVFSGGEGKAFIAGADIAEMRLMEFQDAKTFLENGCTVMQMIEDMEMPVIAALNGFVLGGGLELALACDIRVAAQTATLGLPETSLSIIPGFGGTIRLPQVTGYAVAAEMIFSARTLDAEQAKEYGLVNRVVQKQLLMDDVMEMANRISRNAPLAVRAAKQSLRKAESTEMENFLCAQLFLTADQKMGMNNFINKRKTERYLGE